MRKLVARRAAVKAVAIASTVLLAPLFGTTTASAVPEAPAQLAADNLPRNSCRPSRVI